MSAKRELVTCTSRRRQGEARRDRYERRAQAILYCFTSCTAQVTPRSRRAHRYRCCSTRAIISRAGRSFRGRSRRRGPLQPRVSHAIHVPSITRSCSVKLAPAAASTSPGKCRNSPNRDPNRRCRWLSRRTPTTHVHSFASSRREPRRRQHEMGLAGLRESSAATAVLEAGLGTAPALPPRNRFSERVEQAAWNPRQVVEAGPLPSVQRRRSEQSGRR